MGFSLGFLVVGHFEQQKEIEVLIYREYLYKTKFMEEATQFLKTNIHK